ncbi:MAG: hypothetical protein NTW07_11800 [candidate division Zixibacteria bacterium]|nr:hypothetical protein [candidate division Zixibacteria bacterium]
MIDYMCLAFGLPDLLLLKGGEDSDIDSIWGKHLVQLPMNICFAAWTDEEWL